MDRYIARNDVSMKMKEILLYIMFFRVAIADLLYLLCDVKTKQLIIDDLTRYMHKETTYKKAGIKSLNYCLLYGETFRNVFYFRIQGHGFLKAISRCFLKPIITIEIGGNIAGGLRINHKNAVVFPYSAGRNLTVGPNVVIGKGSLHDNGDINCPIIGDNVTIMPNAVVSGGIKLGDNVSVGAGTILVKSVPNNCTVVGNPARLLER